MNGRDHRHLFGNQRNKTISEEQPPKVQSRGPLKIYTLTEEIRKMRMGMNMVVGMTRNMALGSEDDGET
jgi:hypothetical protein